MAKLEENTGGVTKSKLRAYSIRKGENWAIIANIIIALEVCSIFDL